MKLHTVFITFNRLELTKRAITTYLETIDVPYSMVVVDNASSDGTRKWLTEMLFEDVILEHVLLERNHYPGYACNRGWMLAPEDATHLQRADNDMAFLPGWCRHVERQFRHPKVGQVGLRTAQEEFNVRSNVGGNCVILRKLWDLGLRYDERPWPKFPPGMSEDSYFSPAVQALGYRWERVRNPCLESLASGDWDDPYYAKSFGDRRIKRGTLLTERRRRA